VSAERTVSPIPRGASATSITEYSYCSIADRFGRKIAFYCIWLVLLCVSTSGLHCAHPQCICCESFGRVWQVWLVAKLTSGYAVGSVQFLTGSYVTEIAPARVRGFLLLFYSVWYGLGQLFSTIALKVMSVRNPNDYLTVIYCEWAVLGVMGLVYAFIPESPCKSTISRHPTEVQTGAPTTASMSRAARSSTS
jgi:SP family general alpha glucoside:H+ symporter-like MFS transporter